MTRKKLQKWINAVSLTIMEYENGTHTGSNCAFCKMTGRSKANGYDCSKCILATGMLNCTAMPTYKRAVHSLCPQSRDRISFHKELKIQLEEIMYHFKDSRVLQEIQKLAWTIELEFNENRTGINPLTLAC